jgi:heme-degrading monooxygenase HmoA
MSKIVSAVHHTVVSEGDAAQVESKLKSQAGHLEKVPGFMYYRLLRPLDPDDTYAVLTFWQSRKHYHAALTQNQISFLQ